jgi:hypothetical protein
MTAGKMPLDEPITAGYSVPVFVRPGEPRDGPTSLANLPIRRHTSSFDHRHCMPVWWKFLHRDARNGAVCLSSAWMGTWIETYGAHFKGEWVWWSCNEKIVGGCLLLHRAIRVGLFSFETLFLNASGATFERSPLAEYNDILYVTGFDDAIATDLAIFLSDIKWDRFVLTGCSTYGIIGRVISAIPFTKTEIELKPAPYVDMNALSHTPYISQLTSNTRSQIRRTERIYRDTCGPVSMTSAASLEAAQAYFRELIEMHNARWTRKGLTGSFSNGPAVEFHEKLIRELWPMGGVNLICVKAGESTIGVLYNFIAHQKVFFFQSGFVYQADNKMKPGLLTHYLAIESYKGRGLLEYDFLAGDSQYKRSFSTHERQIFWGTIYRKEGMVRFFLCAKRIKALLRKGKERFG